MYKIYIFTMSGVEYKNITNDDSKNILEFLKRTFWIYEPLNEAVNLSDNTSDDFTELDDDCLKSIVQGFSWKAINSDNGHIVSVLINAVIKNSEDIADELEKEMTLCKNEKFKEILNVLTIRERKAEVWKKFPNVDEFLEIKFAATDPNWLRQGITTRLMNETEKQAISNGIKMLRVDASSFYTGVIANKLGYECISTIKYSDITTLNMKPPHLEDKVFVKHLS